MLLDMAGSAKLEESHDSHVSLALEEPMPDSPETNDADLIQDDLFAEITKLLKERFFALKEARKLIVEDLYDNCIF